MSEYEIINILNTILDSLYNDPVYLVIAIILTCILAYSLIKKLVKLMLYVLALMVIYLAFLYMTGKELPKNFDEFRDGVKDLKDSVEESIQKNIVTPIIGGEDSD